MKHLFKKTWIKIVALICILAILLAGGFFIGRLVTEKDSNDYKLTQAILISVNQSISNTLNQESIDKMVITDNPVRISEYYLTYTKDDNYIYQWVTLGNPLESGAVSFLGNKYSLNNETQITDTENNEAE